MQRTVLAVYGHPDDEVFGCGGALAALAANGCKVHLLCATRGEEGEIADPSIATRENIAEVREQELRCSCAALGIEAPVFLNYRDSGMPGTEANKHPDSFASADFETVVRQTLDYIEEVHPDTLITFEPNGGYGHPDHVGVHKATTAAFERLQGTGTGAPRVLLYQAIRRSELMAVAQQLKDLNINPTAFNDVDWNMMGTPDDDVNAEVDVSEFVDRKLKAIQCHQTQRDDWGPWAQLPPDLLRQFASTESFIVAVPRINSVRKGTVEETFGDL